YGYSIFNLDAMSILAQTLTTKEDNLWTWTLPDGRGMAKAVAEMYPYLADKSKWPKAPDVMYFDEWPVRQPCLLFAGIALEAPEFCASHKDDNSAECKIGNKMAFVVHGLWPQLETSQGPTCTADGQTITDEIASATAKYIPTRQLMQHEWDHHGTCSGLKMAE